MFEISPNYGFKSDKKNRMKDYIAAIAIIFLATPLLTPVARAAPCPMETPMYGGAILDGSDDEYEQYFVVDDDDLTHFYVTLKHVSSRRGGWL